MSSGDIFLTLLFSNIVSHMNYAWTAISTDMTGKLQTTKSQGDDLLHNAPDSSLDTVSLIVWSFPRYSVKTRDFRKTILRIIPPTHTCPTWKRNTAVLCPISVVRLMVSRLSLTTVAQALWAFHFHAQYCLTKLCEHRTTFAPVVHLAEQRAV